MSTTILITGAAGGIGSSLTAQLHDTYDLRLADVRQPSETYGCTYLDANIADLDEMRQACKGVEVVVHLAANPDPEAAWDVLLPANVIGTYNVFEAARDQGCRRVVYASSVHAVAGYDSALQVQHSMPPKPQNLYGATKVWGEALASQYAIQHKLSVFCLRFGWVVERTSLIQRHDGPLDAALTYEDLGRLVVASIEAPADLMYGVYHGVSNNRWKRFDISNAREQLGYEPQDDAFALTGVYEGDRD